MKNLGPMAFLVGVLLSIILGFVSLGEVGVYLLLILGVIVGFFNIQKEEVVKYLVSIVALLFSANALMELFALIPGIGPVLTSILGSLVAFLSAGAAVVAVKELLSLAQN